MGVTDFYKINHNRSLNALLDWLSFNPWGLGSWTYSVDVCNCSFTSGSGGETHSSCEKGKGPIHSPVCVIPQHCLQGVLLLLSLPPHKPVPHSLGSCYDCLLLSWLWLTPCPVPQGDTACSPMINFFFLPFPSYWERQFLFCRSLTEALLTTLALPGTEFSFFKLLTTELDPTRVSCSLFSLFLPFSLEEHLPWFCPLGSTTYLSIYIFIH